MASNVEAAPQKLGDGQIKPVFLTASELASKTCDSFTDPKNGHCSWKTLFSAGLTPSDKLTAGIATCPPQTGHLAHHRHEHAELYFILEGEAMMRIDGHEQRVAKGDVVFIPGNAEHGIRNLRDNLDVVWFYCFAADRFEDIVYRFSSSEETVPARKILSKP